MKKNKIFSNESLDRNIDENSIWYGFLSRDDDNLMKMNNNIQLLSYSAMRIDAFMKAMIFQYFRIFKIFKQREKE